MLNLHEWTIELYPEKKKEQHTVTIPKYWFAEGEGYKEIETEITIYGTANVSHEIPNQNFATSCKLEYGIVIYKNQKITVIAPFPEVTTSWRYYGYPW
jgi:hypothetical protein